MGYNTKVTSQIKVQPMCKRRSFLPEPSPLFSSNWAKSVFVPNEQQIYRVAVCQEESRKRHRKQRSLSAQCTHISFLTAIRNCLFNIQRPSKRKQSCPRRKDHSETLCDLLNSLKCDIQKMAKFEQEFCTNPENVKCADPFFLLPAMMCKLNKLEECIVRAMDCEKKLGKRKEILITASCIRKFLHEQLRCDEKLLSEKRKKLCCLIKSLQIFEKQLLCSAMGLSYVCDTGKKKSEPSPSGGALVCIPKEVDCPNIDNDQCNKKDKAVDCCQLPSDSCPDPEEITGMTVVYTKSHLEKDCTGTETSTVQNQVSWDMNNDCQISFIKNGKKCCNYEDPVLRARVKQVTGIWLESARQLINSLGGC